MQPASGPRAVLLVSLIFAACGGSPGSGQGTGGAGAGGTSATGGHDATTGGHGAATGGTGGFAPSGGATAGSGASAEGGRPGEAGTSGSSGGKGGHSETGSGGSGGSLGKTGGHQGDTGGAAGAPSSGSGGQAGNNGQGGGEAGWVGTWTGAPQLVETANLPPSALSNSVLRQVVRVSLGGSRLRVRLSNEFGNGAVAIKGAHVATCKSNPVDSSIDGATDKPLAFSSAASVSIPAGQAVWSDPVDFPLTALGNLAITMAFGAVPTNVTGHPGSRTTSYEQASSTNLSATSMGTAQKVDHWYYISGVDVVGEPGARGLVILGDSITDGRGTTTNGNDRWPDDLAKRLQANAATRTIAVLNQGIGGNTLADPSSLGPRALDRYSRDVLGQSGVRWVIVFEGVNDIGAGASAASVTAAYDQLIAMAHARQLAIYGATITPFNGHSYYSAEHETARQAVNTYIRSGKFDAVIDFDAAVRDPANATKLQAAYDVDGLHMNPAGYQKLADTVDLKLFTP